MARNRQEALQLWGLEAGVGQGWGNRQRREGLLAAGFRHSSCVSQRVFTEVWVGLERQPVLRLTFHFLTRACFFWKQQSVTHNATNHLVMLSSSFKWERAVSFKKHKRSETKADKRALLGRGVDTLLCAALPVRTSAAPTEKMGRYECELNFKRLLSR